MTVFIRIMLLENPRPWHMISILIMATVLILKYSHKMKSLSEIFHFKTAPLPSPHYLSVDSAWWRNRFSEEEKKKMSKVARRIFLGETSPSSTSCHNSSSPQSSYLILMWRYGKITSRRYFNAYQEKTRNPFENCSVCNCNISYSDEDILQADAVVFHLHKLKTSDMDDILKLPRKSTQRWVFITDESPQNTKLFENKLNSQFNWSMTYRSDSDVPVPYARVIRNTLVATSTSFQKRDFHGEKERVVAILASNCGGKSGRYHYLDNLIKHISVDVWGGCGKRYNMSFSCPGHFTADCPDIAKYRFYLAFENSLCSEYITEKLWWNAYQKFVIPIVMGGLSKHDYEKLAPPGSFIHVDDFNSSLDLAKYINFLNDNPQEYNKHHSWRDKYSVLNEHGYFGAPIFHYCRLCEALNSNSLESKIYQDLGSFWNNKRDCRMTKYK